MKKGNLLSKDAAVTGLKVKIKLPRIWAQVPIHKPHAKGPFCWVKGTIKSVAQNRKSITVTTRYKYGNCCVRLFVDNLFIVAPKDSNYFDNIYLIKK